MGKIKEKVQRHMSLKWSFFLYLPIGFVMSFAGAYAIGVGTNYLQDWYRAENDKAAINPEEGHYEIVIDEYGHANTVYVGGDIFMDKDKERIYFLISNAQVILIPMWVMFSIGFIGWKFYNRELREPIEILMKASRKISENQLDFEVYYHKKNELGMLCGAFDEMRRTLYENNRELWHSLEERKRLNSAFSHDLRTPLTVLRGYAEFLEKYCPDGKVSQEKLLSVLGMMKGQISRLEHYTQKMNTVQKLEDIIPDRREISFRQLADQLSETGKLICGEKKFSIRLMTAPDVEEQLTLDPELVMQVYENLVSNAVRYAGEHISAGINLEKGMLGIVVCDDGPGFSQEALEHATEPFYREEGSKGSTFGLGLYICRIICEKCGGRLSIANSASGAGSRVTAEFPVCALPQR